MGYTSWFIPLCVGVSLLFSLVIVWLTWVTLRFRAKIYQKYDRGNFHG
ncbi:hypothetical protein J2Z69_003046 [Paenibacillus shirakamiensis]|uniref:Uncharacterized protein n=1 Tax=Paenibacillus shirakamiensis TaxID=1265935 RepID=A0ABS4JJV2_9BACL|nr:hypothetical protein [Paenibacillus shirakamiensis]